MKHSKDPFEAAIEEDEVSPPESPVGLDENETEDQTALNVSAHGGDDANINPGMENRLTSRNVPISAGTAGPSSKMKEEDEEEEEENMDVQLGKFASSSDPDKLSKMQSILSKFTEEQMSSLFSAHVTYDLYYLQKYHRGYTLFLAFSWTVMAPFICVLFIVLSWERGFRQNGL